MKRIKILILPLLFVTLASCNFESDHPQAGLLKDQTATGMDEVSIRRFSDSLDHSIATYNKQYSLIYTHGDQSLYVERYAASNPLNRVYLERLTTSSGSMLKKYYFKNDSLILVETSSKQNMENAPKVSESRIYFRNNTVFKKESRSTTSFTTLKATPYKSDQNKASSSNEENYLENVQLLDDAIQQRNQFALVFDNITTYPDARYLVMRSKDQNGYTANVLIEEGSPLVDSLVHEPTLFKEQKLKFKWKVKGDEAVYVPESASITSASGLNK